MYIKYTDHIFKKSFLKTNNWKILHYNFFKYCRQGAILAKSSFGSFPNSWGMHCFILLYGFLIWIWILRTTKRDSAMWKYYFWQHLGILFFNEKFTVFVFYLFLMFLYIVFYLDNYYQFCIYTCWHKSSIIFFILRIFSEPMKNSLNSSDCVKKSHLLFHKVNILSYSWGR